MKLRIALTSLLALVLVVCAALGHRAAADHREVALRAALRGLNEVPPTTSRATATLRATLDEAGQRISFTLEYRNMMANPTAAHFHFGPTKVNGGVMVFLCGGGGQPACPPATSGKITGTITAANVVGPGDQGIAPRNFADVVYAILTGNAYVNIHSSRFPNGELRGQVEPSGAGRAEDRAGSED
ncbi:MAG TPA: CHRD domain-containing protein [Kofleriaceae bacterium]